MFLLKIAVILCVGLTQIIETAAQENEVLRQEVKILPLSNWPRGIPREPCNYVNQRWKVDCNICTCELYGIYIELWCPVETCRPGGDPKPQRVTSLLGKL